MLLNGRNPLLKKPQMPGTMLRMPKRSGKSAESAATSATSAANSATEAQQVLEAIPQVDASGNMTLAGNITAAGGTFDAVVNANGGINIPLAVGAVTDTSAVNRLYAAGMAGVTGILTSNAFLNTDAITASGSSTVTKTVPYHWLVLRFPRVLIRPFRRDLR